MKTSRCFVSVATVVLAVDLVVGLDPQPQENVWRNSNGSRPWQNPAWATSSKQPIHIASTQRTLSPGHIERHSLVSTGQQTTQQPKSSSPITASYSSVVGPSAQKNSNYSPSSYNSRQPSHQKRKDSLQPKPLFAAPTSITQATDQELAMLSEKFFEDDVSSYGENIKIDYQAQTRSNSIKDEAPKPLLNVEAEALNKPTVKALLQLYDNYIADSSFVESVTAQERLEESKFLDEVLQTTVMMEAMDFLVEKGLVKNNSESFKDLLKSLWFTQYTRGGGIIGSSAFEHVFLGELKKDEVSGLHNWIYFANEEKNHRADYMGYLKKLQLGKERNLLKVHFRWSDVLKPSGSMFVGTSPELELALYTVCFLTRPDDRCPVKLGGKTFGIQTYTYRLNRNRGNVIGSAYPVF